ncbi:MAG: hypothetical protein IJ109_01645 [Firmicutes bacterium]|nr:hypothetical protein [Bacillota bacterium]
MTVFVLTLNNSLVSFTAMYMNLRIMDLVFDRRRGLALWAGYFSAKAVAASFFSAAVYCGMEGSLISSLRILFLLVTAVASYAVLYYTWRTDILRIGVIALVSDFVSGISSLLGSSLTNLIMGRSWQMTFMGMDTPSTLLAGALALLLFSILFRLTRPIIRRIARIEARHRGLVSLVIILMIAALTMSQLADILSFTIAQFVMLMVFSGVTVFSAVYFARRIPRETSRREALRRQIEMQQAYRISIREQAEELTRRQASLQQIEQRLERLSREDMDQKKAHLGEMQEYLRQLQSGTFCDEPVTDAVLTAFAKELGEQGVRVSLRAGSLAGCGGQAAQIAWILLHWAQEVCLDDGKGRRSRVDSVTLRIMRCRNQLVFVLELAGEHIPRFPRRHLERAAKGSSVTVEDLRAGGGRKIRAMTEVQPWVF